MFFFFAFLQDFSLIISKSLESNDLLKENSSKWASHPERIFFKKIVGLFFSLFSIFLELMVGPVLCEFMFICRHILETIPRLQFRRPHNSLTCSLTYERTWPTPWPSFLLCLSSWPQKQTRTEFWSTPSRKSYTMWGLSNYIYNNTF